MTRSTQHFPLVVSVVLIFSLLVTTVFAERAAPSANTTVRYFSQLDANQKAFYQEIKTLSTPPDNKSITIDLPEPITYSAGSDGGSVQADKKIAKIGQGALDALLYDHPAMLWIDKKNCSTTGNAQGQPTGSGRFMWTVDSLTLTLGVTPGWAKKQTALQAAVIAPSGSTRYEQVRSLHNALADRVVFSEAENIYSAYGALVEGQAVCEGYAKAFKILCDKVGIPCILVAGMGVTDKTATQGENHMWNYVKMDDGKWYAVDVTWDDQVGQLCEDFFLVGSQTVSSAQFGQATFAQSHIPDGDFSKSDIVFQYPALSDTRFVP